MRYIVKRYRITMTNMQGYKEFDTKIQLFRTYLEKKLTKEDIEDLKIIDTKRGK